MTSSEKGDIVTVPRFDFMAIVLVLAGSAKSGDGTLMDKHSTWYVLPGT